jgi:hypothetical protein
MAFLLKRKDSLGGKQGKQKNQLNCNVITDYLELLKQGKIQAVFLRSPSMVIRYQW